MTSPVIDRESEAIRTFVIDALPEQALKYRDDHVVVAIDIFRATTTILTALHGGRQVYPVTSEVEARTLASQIPDALLAGEQGGTRPHGFAFNNSPAVIAGTRDYRPLILLSSAGTQLLGYARGAPAIYVASFRNLSATAAHLAHVATRVALIGAGTRGEPRAEDSIACARMGRLLTESGFLAENSQTAAEVARWADVGIESVRVGPSADYLRASDQEADIDFVIDHVDDLELVVAYDGSQATITPVAREALAS
jgi:2-phosphosulfolactate phosphatase